MYKYIYEALSRASSFLIENKREEPVARLLLQHVLNKTHAQLLADMREPMSETEYEHYWSLIEKHVKGKPIQYLTGYEEFYGRNFEVNEHVLIPRPETEELVYETMNRVKSLFSNKTDLQVADIGTGSGVIGISLKLEQPSFQVTVTDLSQDALDMAKRNAESLGADIHFKQGDLSKPIAHQKWDVVLSNPPYIAFEEAETLSDSVYEYEPHSALFAEEQGLYLYKRLSEELPSLMNKPGLIGLEIGHEQGPTVQEFFQLAFPKAKVDIVKDINGKNRMIFCEISE
ncbi:peptide chain release factor N(5)-glutamine methyltransferase [Paenisporosarcina quisquiliarum]|uniref:peptide chain release factor N(5)-glutamine methyltransferase n=1 Tax=Paenisporosarcina quisquiliarum TaxID=365346 RepID=UPI003737111F